MPNIKGLRPISLQTLRRSSEEEVAKTGSQSATTTRSTDGGQRPASRPPGSADSGPLVDHFEGAVSPTRLQGLLPRSGAGRASGLVSATPIDLPRPQPRPGTGPLGGPDRTATIRGFLEAGLPAGNEPPGLGSGPQAPTGPQVGLGGLQVPVGPGLDGSTIPRSERPLAGQGLPGGGAHGPGHTPLINPRFGGAQVAEGGAPDPESEDDGFRSDAQQTAIETLETGAKSLGGQMTDFTSFPDGSVEVEITDSGGSKHLFYVGTDGSIENEDGYRTGGGGMQLGLDDDGDGYEERGRLQREHGAEIERATGQSQEPWIGRLGNPVASTDGSGAAGTAGAAAGSAVPGAGTFGPAAEELGGWRGGAGPVDPVDENADGGRDPNAALAGSVLSRLQVIDPIEVDREKAAAKE